ncbi:17287_t:CDS:2 [Dentiscutata erythropus]|uniref:17287_t:CDS:1 n=1 Tax=Dentiscutata erythropus TaxID=1348616 RepID=A0A9N9HYP8_9GLOM|nr:17287_t:CDS:2 [Dentiscutata erythropus]
MPNPNNATMPNPNNTTIAKTNNTPMRRTKSFSSTLAATSEDKTSNKPVSTIDEFLLFIHNKVLLLTKSLPNDYCVTFKTQREAGAGTQLVDEQDFIKFKSEYSKLATKKNDIGIYIMESDLDNNDDDDTKGLNYALTSYDKIIAKNILEICKAHNCSIYNQPCFNRENHKDLYVEIIFMMLSIWALDMNKDLATIEAPSTHPLFSHANILSKKLSKVTSLLLLPPSPTPTVQLFKD